MPTLRDIVKQAEAQLATGPHPDRARLDAETLLLHALGKDRAWLLANWNQPADPGTFASLVGRRQTGEPIQYILGEAEFFGLPFTVTPAVLIPRPETEHLVEEVIRLAANFAELSPLRIADIGTGSGAIAVALAHALPQAQLTATDLSPDSLTIAAANAQRNQVADRINFLNGDLLAPIANQQFEIIASNPPYIPLTDYDSLAIEVRNHEPHAALFAGNDGLQIYRLLIPEACNLLVPNGWLVLEIGFGQQPAIEQLLGASSYQDVQFIPDYQGIPRVAAARYL